MSIRTFAKQWLPPQVVRSVERLRAYFRPASWEYVGSAWRNTELNPRGWNVPSVVETQQRLWPSFLRSIDGTAPLGIPHGEEPSNKAVEVHNLYLAFAYVAALAAHEKRTISILDWGSGIGHYCALAKSVLPSIDISYYCYDLPAICSAGQALLPGVQFLHDKKECFSRKYDLVIASASLWYAEDWRSLADKLVEASSGYVYLTRMLFVRRGPSFVAIQRPWSIGYRTEYLCWIFNHEEFVSYICGRGAKLVREFFISEGPYIHRAPQQASYWGFLFQNGLARTNE